MNKLSVTIITLNEEAKIAGAIESVKNIADEIVVVDSGSTDQTVSIAKNLGAKVYNQKYLGDGYQKRFAVSKCQNDWILALDADERIDGNLGEILNKLLIDPTVVYCLNRKNHIGSRWVKYGDAYPDWVARIFNRRITNYSETIEHAKVQSDTYQKLNVHIIHLGNNSLLDLYSKSLRFANRSAKAMFNSGEKGKSPIFSGLWMFLKLYVLKFGFLGATDGFHYCLSAAFRSYMKYSILNELRRDDFVRKQVNNDSKW